MGNFSPVGGANTGEPFAMLIFPGAQIVALDLTGATSVRIGINGPGEIVHKIDPKFLPGGIYTVAVDLSVDGGNSLQVAAVDKEFAEVAAMVTKPDVQVRAFVRISSLGTALHYYSMTTMSYNAADTIEFTAPYNEYAYIFVTMNADGSVEFGNKNYKTI